MKKQIKIIVIMEEVTDSKDLGMCNTRSEIPIEVKRELYKMGFSIGNDNDTIKAPLTDAQLKKAAELLIPYVGLITKLHTWYSKPIESHRIVFGH